MVLELYTNILRDLPGIASVARRYIKTALALAVFISLMLVGIEREPSTVPQYFLVCDRVVISSLVFFILSALMFLVYYPVPLSRNVVIYSLGLAPYLLIKAATFFVDNLRYYSWYREVNIVMVGASTGCLLFWLFALNKQGETKAIVVGHQWNPSDERRLLSQLQHINDSLLRVAKK